LIYNLIKTSPAIFFTGCKLRPPGRPIEIKAADYTRVAAGFTDKINDLAVSLKLKNSEIPRS